MENGECPFVFHFEKCRVKVGLQLQLLHTRVRSHVAKQNQKRAANIQL